MLAGALLGLGGAEAEQRARQHLRAVGIDPQVVHVGETTRGGFAARTFEVDDEPGFVTFAELIAAVSGAEELPQTVRDTVVAAARRMAAAEAEVHTQSMHIHELAGLDTAVDLITVASLLETLQPARVISSPPALGGGYVETAHGRLSVPAPAVAAILRGFPTAGGSHEDGELTTPTGAALLTQVTDEFGPLPAGTIAAVSYGAGKRELTGRPNVLRAVLVTETSPALRGSLAASANDASLGGAGGSSGGLQLLETNIDDATPEVLAHAAERVRAGGALDVWLTPAYMKKGRPGVVLHALVRVSDTERLAGLLFAETTTFGVRVTPVGRLCLDERTATVEVLGARVRARLGYLDGRLVTASPEYEDCAAAAEAAGVPVKRVYETACALLHEQSSVW